MNQIPLARRIRAGLDIVAGLTIVAAFIVLLTDQVQTGSFEPGKHFAYLTNQTSYSNIVVLLAGGFLALSRQADTVLYTTVRANFVAYAFVVGVVYNALLRGPDDFGFHNEVTHVVIPVYLVTDWVMRSARPRIGWKTVWIGISYPVVWMGVTLLRAPSVEWYPYFFLDPTGPNGWAGVGVYVLAITVVFAGLISAQVALNHAQARKRENIPPFSTKTTISYLEK
jgi:hypothetical protein